MNCRLCKLAFALLRYIVFYCKLRCDTSEPQVSYISRACSSLVRQPYYIPNRFFENQRIGNHTCDQERPLGWQNILYRRIYVDFSFLTVHKVCTKAILLGVQAYRFCAPQSCGHSNGEYVGWSPNRVTPLNMGL